jgi:hypothetical protein
MRALKSMRRIPPPYFCEQKAYSRSIFNEDEVITIKVVVYCIPEHLETSILVPKPAPVP